MSQVIFTDQTLTFLLSVALGAALCILFDFTRIIRLCTRGTFWAVFFEDIAFFAICGIVTYCFLIIRCMGSVRGYVIVGEAVGFIVCRATLSRLIMLISNKIVKFIKKLIKWFTNKLWNPFSRFLGKIFRNIQKSNSNIIKKAKKLLKRVFQLLYNRFSSINKGKKQKTEKRQTDEIS